MSPQELTLYDDLLATAEWPTIVDGSCRICYVDDDETALRTGPELSAPDAEGVLLNMSRQKPWKKSRLFIVRHDSSLPVGVEVRELDRATSRFPLYLRERAWTAAPEGPRSRLSALAS
jgi:hypothetical protein